MQSEHMDVLRRMVNIASKYVSSYELDEYEPSWQKIVVKQAYRLAELRLKYEGVLYDFYSEPPVLDGEYHDNYDIDALKIALSAAAESAENTYADVGEDARNIFVTIVLTKILFFFAFDENNDTSENPELIMKEVNSLVGKEE